MLMYSSTCKSLSFFHVRLQTGRKSHAQEKRSSARRQVTKRYQACRWYCDWVYCEAYSLCKKVGKQGAAADLGHKAPQRDLLLPTGSRETQSEPCIQHCAPAITPFCTTCRCQELPAQPFHAVLPSPAWQDPHTSLTAASHKYNCFIDRHNGHYPW